MTNTNKLLRATFTFAGIAFVAVSFTRLTYTYDSVEAESEGVELYRSVGGLETFLTYTDPASPLGQAAARALAGAL